MPDTLLKAEKCLVVSRLKETWCSKSELLFIHESVLDFNDKPKNRPFTVLDNVWDEVEYEKEAVNFIENKAKIYQCQLAEHLNEVHHVNYTTENWGVILDAWLIHLLSTVYDCLKKVQRANQEHQPLFIQKANIEAKLPPFDAMELVYHQQSDVFTHMVYIEAARVCEIQIKEPVKDVQLQSVNQYAAESSNWAKWMKNRFFLGLAKLVIRLRRPALIIDGYFVREDAIKIMKRSMGKVVFLPSRFVFQKVKSKKEINDFARGRLHLNETDDFDKMVNALLPICLPRSFLEDYSSIVESVSGWASCVRSLGTATCQYTSDAYKIAAAKVRRDGGRLLGFQHGGGYNVFKLGHFDWLEIDYVDRYYGWGKPFSYNMGTPKLRCLGEIKKIKRVQQKNILFVSTNPTRHMFLYVIRENFNTFIGYVANQFLFYKTLNPIVKNDFVLRPYLRDHGWCYKERWQAEFSNSIEIDPNSSFYDSLMAARLYVTDHISTTWLEALYSGVPIVMYFSLERYVLNERVFEIFIQLKNVGVIHETAEEAASFINSKYDVLEEWWNDPQTKRAVDLLKDHSFVESGSFVEDWSAELLPDSGT